MSNLSKDIQCVGSDTRPPMLDRTDFASWEQRIRLYCRGHMGQCEDALGRVRINQRRSGITTTNMSRMQLNSKFVNNMLPEWGRFVIAVKLNRGLRGSNYDQLYAYLKQHEAHANENKTMLDRFTQHTVDPLALMSNVSHQQHYSQSSSTPPSTYIPPYLADNARLDSGLSLTDNLIKFNQHVCPTHPIIQNIPTSNKQSTLNFIKYKEPSYSSRWQGCSSECLGSTE
nr:retrovirus-related Pol polyprotein from transposon TNT 1-94 [Tanacetum cinerariifolium]